jgi:proline racemase
MKFNRMITAVDTHAEGAPERIVTGGMPPIPGDSMMEKMCHVYEHWDDVRTLLVDEPRGNNVMCASFITEPTVDEADVGIIFVELGDYITMCGHGVIAICTALVEMGLVEAEEPTTLVTLDTPAGLVRAQVAVQDGKAESVTFQNVPSFLYKADVEVDVPTLGKVKLDIGFGGAFYAILPADSAGVTVEPEYQNDIIAHAARIRDAVNEQVDVSHPEKPEINFVPSVMFSTSASDPRATMKNALVYPPGQIDRSPCGTGTSAKMAILHGKGELELHEDFVHESIIGTLFYGKLIGETKVGSLPAVVPTITGRAWITGIQQFVLDPSDPFPAGFHLGERGDVFVPGY